MFGFLEGKNGVRQQDRLLLFVLCIEYISRCFMAGGISTSKAVKRVSAAQFVLLWIIEDLSKFSNGIVLYIAASCSIPSAGFSRKIIMTYTRTRLLASNNTLTPCPP